jgi:hypothetical protein
MAVDHSILNFAFYLCQQRASVEKQLLGTETVHAMRAKGVTAVICGLSANDVEEQFLNAGSNYFMYKPFPCKKVRVRCCYAAFVRWQSLFLTPLTYESL